MHEGLQLLLIIISEEADAVLVTALIVAAATALGFGVMRFFPSGDQS